MMNTPAHLLIGAAVFGGRGNNRTLWAAFVGASLPDLSLYVLAGSALYLFGIPPQVVFNELYYSETWQMVFALDNSFFVWGILFFIAWWRQIPWAIALTGAAILHLCLDIPVHHDDGRAHFWPLTTWIFESPVSYWDTRHGAWWFAPLGAVGAWVAAITLWRRRSGWLVASFVMVLLGAELWVVNQWLFVFIDS